jgi:purine-binding chemotaxis protein CheW
MGEMSDPGGRRLEVLVFEIGEQRYGIPVSGVREVVRAVTLVRLPGGPAIVEGIINMRGRVVPVLDLRARFRLPAKDPEHTDHLIVGWAGPRLVAVRADRALGLVALDSTEIEDPGSVTAGVEYITGVAKVRDGLLLIHDLGAVLSQAEAEAVDGALEEAGSGAGR